MKNSPQQPLLTHYTCTARGRKHPSSRKAYKLTKEIAVLDEDTAFWNGDTRATTKAGSQNTKSGTTPNWITLRQSVWKEVGATHTPEEPRGGCRANMVLRCMSCRAVIIDIRSDAIQMEHCGDDDLGTAMPDIT